MGVETTHAEHAVTIRRVLVLDDDFENGNLLRKGLPAFSASLLPRGVFLAVDPVISVTMARTMLKSYAYDVALIDVHLGSGGSSAEFCEELRGRKIPFLRMTADPLAAAELSAELRGVGVFSKPFKLDEVAKAIVGAISSEASTS